MYKDENFVRSPSNKGALLNVDNKGLEAYKLRKKRYNDLKDIGELKDRMENLENMMKLILDKLDTR